MARCPTLITSQISFMKLMIMIKHIEKLFDKSQKKGRPPVEWVQDGHVVYIRDKDTLARDWLPLFFQQTKFSRYANALSPCLNELPKRENIDLTR